MANISMEKPYIEINQGYVKINGQDVNTIKELNVKYEPMKNGVAEVVIKLDAKVDIKGTAEIKQEETK